MPTDAVEHVHADVTGGWLRPAVFGASDGLVSNFALIAGITPRIESCPGIEAAFGDAAPAATMCTGRLSRSIGRTCSPSRNR